MFTGRTDRQAQRLGQKRGGHCESLWGAEIEIVVPEVGHQQKDIYGSYMKYMVDIGLINDWKNQEQSTYYMDNYMVDK